MSDLATPLFETEYILGIDPGFTGAAAIFDPKTNRIISLMDMPVTKAKGQKSQIVASELSNWIGTYSPQLKLCVMEDVSARPGQGVVSMFRFGFAAGVAHGIVASYMIPMVLVKPQTWKGLMGLSKDKAQSIERVKAMLPKDASHFTAKKDGRAEAALLAIFGKRFPV